MHRLLNRLLHRLLIRPATLASVAAAYVWNEKPTKLAVMKAVVQRCRAAAVRVEGEVVGQIDFGLTVFVAALEGDNDANAVKLAHKIAGLRIFSNEDGKFDLSVLDVGGSVLVVSNFTLAGETKKGNRPSFANAARPEVAAGLVETFAKLLSAQNVPVATGRFGAAMTVTVDNDGPVTILLDT